MAQENSLNQLETEKALKKAPKPLTLLKEIFRLSREPERIEGYDISNLGAKNQAASMVVFTDGKPDKSQYRRFKIRRKGQDDTKAMAEAVGRRFRHDEWRTPDIILIDGGRAQVNAVKDLIPQGVFLLGLAKREEEIILPAKRRPLKLSKDNPALHLLMAVRDEAHRFGRKYHRKLREKDFTG